MEKTVSLTVEQAIFLRNISAVIEAQTFEDSVKKSDFYKSLKPLEVSVAAVLAMKEEDQVKATQDQQIKLTFDSALIDWVKPKWREVPKLYKLRNQTTGEIVQTGFSGEKDLELYIAVDKAIDSAVPVIPIEE